MPTKPRSSHPDPPPEPAKAPHPAEQITTLSPQDRDTLLRLLETPAPPNAALQRAAERYQPRQG